MSYSVKENQSVPEGKCLCGHSGAAHGSNGLICAACECKKFRETFDPERPVACKIP